MNAGMWAPATRSVTAAAAANATNGAGPEPGWSATNKPSKPAASTSMPAAATTADPSDWPGPKLEPSRNLFDHDYPETPTEPEVFAVPSNDHEGASDDDPRRDHDGPAVCGG